MAMWVLNGNETPPASCQGGAVAIGNFDGVHRGHIALVNNLRQLAETLHAPAVAVTFDPHPLQLLRPAQFQPLLTTPEDRAALLQGQGVDHVIVLRTDSDLLRLSAEAFFSRVIRQQFIARALAEGDNFGFGHNREGNIETLRNFCQRDGLTLRIVPPVTTEDGRTISSSRVRDTLMRGNVRETASLLQRPYRIRGVVGMGERRGQTLGFPTANLHQIATLVPDNGVYAVRVFLGDTAWPGAAHIGPNPTFGEAVRKVEIHLIKFQGDLYGKTLSLDFIERIRETRSFPGPAALVEQLRGDVKTAETLLAMAPIT